jgi:tripeptidyl-peptidase-1
VYQTSAGNCTAVEKYIANGPASQTSTKFPAKGTFNATGRAYPDMSAFMDAVPLCEGGSCHDAICGGTSASTPTVAGIFSLINDHRLNTGLPPIGFVNQRLWQVAQDFAGEAFVDVTEGDTSCHCDSGFGATKGWDAMTGWGTPKWGGMLKHFGAEARL